MLTHGLIGFTMGSLWRPRQHALWGFVFISSFLIRENILASNTINIHASLTFIFATNTVPPMNVIHTLFGILVVLNIGFFVFSLHLLYSVFLTRLGMNYSLRLPRWMEKAISTAAILQKVSVHIGVIHADICSKGRKSPRANCFS